MTNQDDGQAAVHRAASTSMNYGDYLALDEVLAAQRPVTDEHDELLFVIQHQTMELWMKLIVHELDGAIDLIEQDRLRESFKMLARVARTLEQLTSAWQVLRTLTPQEYLTFRDSLGDSSGFQSWQYRSIEFLLGNKSAAMLTAHRARPDVQEHLRRRLHEPDLVDVVARLLHRRGWDVSDDVLARDVTRPPEPSPAMQAVWAEVYRAPGEHWDLYELAEKLVDIEDHFRRWRFNHVTTVERIIGAKVGTGGTSGTSYLRRQLDVVLFADLWEVRTEL